MPIKKFRSIEEMDAVQSDTWCEPGEECFRRIAQLWERSARISPKKNWPQGVFKFRNIEEAQAQRERLEAEHVRDVRRERIKTGKIRVIQTPGDRPK